MSRYRPNKKKTTVPQKKRKKEEEEETGYYATCPVKSIRILREKSKELNFKIKIWLFNE